MAEDFLKAWLVEGNAIAAMSYVSEHAYACLAQDSDDPLEFDRGMAPFQLLINLKAAHNSLGPHHFPRRTGRRHTADQGRDCPSFSSLMVRNSSLYSVPDDIAATLDCESRHVPATRTPIKRSYGNYFGTTFYVARTKGRAGRAAVGQGQRLLEDRVLASRRGRRCGGTHPDRRAESDAHSGRHSLALAARGFLESWLVKKQYDAAFAYLSPRSYACYDLERDPAAPASTSAEDAGRKLLAVARVFLGGHRHRTQTRPGDRGGRAVSSRDQGDGPSWPKGIHPDQRSRRGR